MIKTYIFSNTESGYDSDKFDNAAWFFPCIDKLGEEIYKIFDIRVWSSVPTNKEVIVVVADCANNLSKARDHVHTLKRTLLDKYACCTWVFNGYMVPQDNPESGRRALIFHYGGKK